MNVKLYKNSSSYEVVEKTLTGEIELTDVRFKEEGSLNIETPVLITPNFKSDAADIAAYNYMYIPKFKRYYYIGKISYTGGLATIEASECDLLMTYKSDITGSTQLVLRQEEKKNRYIVDKNLILHDDFEFKIKEFGSPVYDTSCLSVVVETAGTGTTVV